MILDFISKFKSAEDLFMCGMCYWFAIILHNRFSDSEIWYEPVANHFVCKIDGVFYDASGIYPCLSSNETGGQNRQVICLQANGIDRKDENGCNGKGWTDDVSYTLNTIDRHAVVFEPKSAAAFMGGQGAKARTIAYSENVSSPLKSVMSGGNTVPDIVYPLVTGAICSSGAGTSRPAGQCNETDMCVVYGVDCRNATVESELTHTLQAKPGGGFSLNCTPSVVQKLASGAEATGTLMACHAQKQWIGNQEAFSGNYHIVASGKNRKYIIRRLTPLECDRLQCYPDNWSQVTYKGKPMSDSARYRMDGNSVAIPCVVRVLGGIAAQTQDIVSD